MNCAYTPLLQRRLLKDSSINLGFLTDHCVMSCLNSRVLFLVKRAVPATLCLINACWMDHFLSSEAESKLHSVHWVLWFFVKLIPGSEDCVQGLTSCKPIAKLLIGTQAGDGKHALCQDSGGGYMILSEPMALWYSVSGCTCKREDLMTNFLGFFLFSYIASQPQFPHSLHTSQPTPPPLSLRSSSVFLQKRAASQGLSTKFSKASSNRTRHKPSY